MRDDSPASASVPERLLAWWRSWPVLGDALLAACLLGGLTLLAGVYYAPVGWMLIILQVMPLIFRRVLPFAAAVAVAVACLLQVALTDDPLPSNVAVVVAIYSVSAEAPHRWQRWATLGIGIAGALIAAIDWMSRPEWAGPRPRLDVLITFAFLVMVVLAAWGLGDVVRRRREVLARLREQNEALARDQVQRARLAAQDERAAIAREMHDIVAHSLSVVVVQADGGAYAARAALDRAGSDTTGLPPQLEQAASTLETIAGTARAALGDTRRLVGVLRDESGAAEYAPQQGLAHLESLVDGVREAGVEVDLAVRGGVDDLSPEVDLAAYRVVQESLTNVLKHAGRGPHVDVDVLRSPGMLLVRVTDDGEGQGSTDGSGNGIVGMTERVQVLGGSLYAGARAGGGFEVVAHIPVAGAPPPQPASPSREDPPDER